MESCVCTTQAESAESRYTRLLARYSVVDSLIDCTQGHIVEGDLAGTAVPPANPAAGALRLSFVACLDALLAGAVSEDDIPFWAEVWDSALGLCRHVWEAPAARLSGAQVLELGCGVGASGLAAAARGAHVTQVDFSPDALEFARYNAAANGLEESMTLVLGDIRTLELPTTFDLIMGSDILYEPKLHEAILRVLDRNLAPAGRVVFADPGRRWASTFVALAAPSGWTYDVDEVAVRGRKGERVIDILTLERGSGNTPGGPV